MDEKRALTGLRGIAATVVMVNHVNSDSPNLLRWFAFENPAVDLFFCLSGFTLGLVYLSPGAAISWRQFAAARVARIYPLYLVSLALAALTVAWQTETFATYPRSLLADTAEQLLLVSAWPIIGNGVQWDLSAWSISTEAFCYALVFPVLAVLTPWASRQSISRRLALLCLFATVATIAAARFDPGAVNWSVPAYGHGSAEVTMTLRGLLMFATGWLAMLSYRNRDALHAFATQAADAIFVFLVILIWLIDTGRGSQTLLLVLFPVLVLALSEQGSVTARVVSSAPVHWLGLTSYSIYLLHFPIMDVLKLKWPFLMQSANTRLAVVVPLVLLASSASYLVVEKPCRYWLRLRLGVHRAIPIEEEAAPAGFETSTRVMRSEVVRSRRD